MFNFILITILGCYVYQLRKKVDKQEIIVGNLKISDLDETFWNEKDS